MPTAKGKITIRQILILFILITLSPAIRLFPQICSVFGGMAAWTAPIIGVIALLISLSLLKNIIKNKNINNLSDFYELSVGKIAGKIILIFYFFWIMILYFLYIRYYAERLLASIFPNVNIKFFILLILILTYMATRGKIETLARFAEVSILLFTIVFIIIFLFLLPTTKASNLLPLTYYDIWPALKSTYPIIGIWGYIILFFIFGDYIKDTDQLVKHEKKAIIYLSAMTTVMMITVIGSLGHLNVVRMPLPFFNAMKVISAMQSFDRFEAVLLSIWIVTDFLIITIFGKFLCVLMKQIFKATEPKYFATPVTLIGYIGSQYIATNKFELYSFSQLVALPINMIICYMIPFIVFFIGKLRKKI